MDQVIWITLSGISGIGLIVLLCAMPGMYSREAERMNRNEKA